MENKKIKIGLIGLGTVGSGVFKTLQNFKNVEVVKIAVHNKNKKRNIEGLDESIITDDAYEVVNNPEIQIVAELVGGINPAFDLIKTAIKNGKHIVTANKELLAKHGEELFNFAEENNKVVLYEAAIAGGIPLIMPIKTILAGNKITKIKAILNGTTNYILTKMDVQGASYTDVLKEAQELGYAEADPTGDVEGFDAAYKITTLATIAFGKRIKIENVYREGITKISPDDMKAANEMGYKIKLIASAELNEDSKADVRVHPMLVPKTKTLAHIDYVTNAVSLSGHPVGDVTLSGPGAGEFPTASSVVGDILAIASEIDKTDYLLPMMRCNHHENAVMTPIEDTRNKYYISITAHNRLGVIGRIGKACEDHNISLASIVQKEVAGDNAAKITVITEICKEKDMQNVINIFNNDPAIASVNSLIRVQF
ncbi:TPA: homoserine dehydrogenase [Candidatus Gastranaerophilales bacterium HUM_6]|jgi:homoserine dehydrogenase|nr:homoserine dehydrogenase [bacterium]MEE0496443.1 homoserine dehydrogenase [Cyanobacteriota bacterium]CDE92025.1 homoserine dehydrogenase [Fusobacterium sp. CAG:815]DAA92073.1 MAG TPA: homoserine dehydrogenase [Candidatus Gastranaerophilales bacterium HUM_7]DAA93087.1 MAG TPA: homoserine dehydrogenase [Candidatus Gastranaerophilales bacterium HUM_6]DAB00669.1 MAG TPA: homoserine dehydrogenase [Candidatus Gastranaerophilales bacterium HUM_12]DAB05565.1 MAG TPA: homoserine dehydrogenase [Cand